MLFGGAWYPEQWPADRWPADLDLMRRCGMNVVRVGEFAWSSLEPAEGRLDFAWLDAAIAAAGEHGISVILCTPTAAPPAWLTSKYPHVLRILADGRPMQHGLRCHGSPFSPAYLAHCRRIAEALARRYGDNANVVGWQIDNEIGEYGFGPEARRQFQDYCRRRYGRLANLNARWHTAYWSQTFFAWDEIPFAVTTQNACLLATAFDFLTETWRRFIRNQAEVIRARRSRSQPITHNFSYQLARQDPHDVSAELDVTGVDPYVFHGHLDPARMGLYLAATRGAKRRPFWVMETQPGSVHYMPVNNALDPGETRRMVWHQVGHGADAVMFWQWRACLGGNEQLHGTVLAPDGTGRPLYDELARTGEELRRLAGVLDGTAVAAPVAIAWSYRDRAAIERCRYHHDFDPWRHLRDHYAALRRLGLDVDVVRADMGLDGYGLVVAPHLNMLEGPLEELLLAYVAGGGHLLLGPRSGIADEHGALLPSRQPGRRLAEALGGHVEEFYALEAPVTLAGQAISRAPGPHGAPEGLKPGRAVRDSSDATASIFAEWLTANAPDTETLLRYESGHPWLAGKAALLSRRVGRGRISCLGCWPDHDTLVKVSQWACAAAGVQRRWPTLPEGVEISCRTASDRRVHVLINHGKEPQKMALPFAGELALTGGKAPSRLDLPPGEVVVLVERPA